MSFRNLHGTQSDLSPPPLNSVPMSFWNLQGTQSDLGPPPLSTVSLEFWNLCKHVVEAKLSIPTVTVQGGEYEAQLNTHYALNLLPGP